MIANLLAVFTALATLVSVQAYTYVGAAGALPAGTVKQVSAGSNNDCQNVCAQSGLNFSFWKQYPSACYCAQNGPLASELINSFQQDQNYYVVWVTGSSTWTACEEHLNSFTPVQTTNVDRPEKCLAYCSGFPGVSNIATVDGSGKGNYECSCYSTRINGYGGTSCKLGNIFVFYQPGAELASGWSAASTSCIAEGNGGRALTGAKTTSNNMTPNQCTNYCQSQGYPLAGVEYGSECYCGAVLSNGASLNNPSNNCNVKCTGASDLKCGGPRALNLFVNQAGASGLSGDYASKPVNLPSGWSSVSCVKEGTSGRALASARTSSSSMTPETCINYCAGQGWQYAGVEYGSECYCGDYLANGADLSLTSGGCTMSCSGDKAQVCGGSNALQLYQNPDLALANTVQDPNYHLQGCIQEVSGRALTGASVNKNDLTVDSCIAFCSQGGFTYAGVEYGSECYCGNELSNGADASKLSTQCNVPCKGNSGQNCGGPNAIQLYAQYTRSPPIRGSRRR
ncbi:hypothetical protein IAT40_006562 [Kwoniella sp. CBS 6097]